MKKIKFIDLFSGIGGFRVGLENLGWECVFSSEIDKHAREMYQLNFSDIPYGDITKIDTKIIPNYDVLCAGFPCQSFSAAGKMQGFKDKTRGTLFFDVLNVLEKTKPQAFILENVKNLVNHDKGKTFKVITESLINCGYDIKFKVLNAKNFGVPQNRERIIIVGTKKKNNFDFNLLRENHVSSMLPFLDSSENKYLSNSEYTLLNKDQIKRQKSDLVFSGYMNKKIRNKGVRPGTMHLSRVHRQVNRIYSVEGVNPTISSQETAGRYFIEQKGKVRKLSINECFRFMGFPDTFKKIGSLGNLYKRIGNSVCVPMIYEIGHLLEEEIKNG